MQLVSNARIYGRAYGTWPWVYRCNACGAYTGVHPESIFPVGTLADQALREARQRVTTALERMRRDGWLTTGQARERLARLLAIPVVACRISTFDRGQCQAALVALQGDAGQPVRESRATA